MFMAWVRRLFYKIVSKHTWQMRYITLSVVSLFLTFAVMQVSSEVCINCSKASNVIKKKRIASVPEVIVFYFRRFMKSGFFQVKDNTLVDFPLENFDLSDFVDMTAGYFRGGWEQRALYDLQVVVRHAGKNKDSNNYTTLARHDPEGKWFEYHDQRVRVVSHRYVASREALMLFYVRKKAIKHGSGGAQKAMVAGLHEAARAAVIERRSAVVDEINYLLRMERLNQVNVLKSNLTLKSSRFIHSIWNSLRSSVKVVAHMKIITGKMTGLDLKRQGAVWDSGVKPLSGRKDILTLASFTEVVMNEKKKKRIIGPKWRIVRKSLQKIVLLGQDPDLTFDHAHIILEIPPRKHIFLSIYWIIKFLCCAEPGPLCNHDIACCHGSLKPHLYSCRKRICIPVSLELFKSIREYLQGKYSYPTCVLPSEACANNENKNEYIFRELQ